VLLEYLGIEWRRLEVLYIGQEGLEVVALLGQEGTEWCGRDQTK
jgi:hypothetical protein